MSMSLDKIAKRVVLYYLQGNGELENKINSLNQAINYTGLNAVFKQTDEHNAEWFAETKEECQKAIEIRNALNKCYPLGHFENEVAAVKAVLRKFKREINQDRNEGK